VELVGFSEGPSKERIRSTYGAVRLGTGKQGNLMEQGIQLNVVVE